MYRQFLSFLWWGADWSFSFARREPAILQMLTSRPSPIAQPAPSFRTSLPAKIPRHPCDIAPVDGQSNKLEDLQYFPSKVCPSKDDGFFRRRQVSLASKASLKCSMSLNPSPPTDLGRVSFSQEIQQSILISGLRSHQKQVSTDCICLHKEAGSLKHDIAYAGIAAKTVLRRNHLSSTRKKTSGPAMGFLSDPINNRGKDVSFSSSKMF